MVAIDEDWEDRLRCGVAGIADNSAVTDMNEPPILPAGLENHIAGVIHAGGGWIGFDEFMALALYTPALGYYANDSQKFGLMPGHAGGGDFATAPEMSVHFGRALARQVAEALRASATTEVWEFGAGTGALAEQVLDALGAQITRYTIVDLSGNLRARQQQRLAAHGTKVHWASELPVRMEGIVLGNEVLDAMPVKLLARLGTAWHERGVVLHEGTFTHADRPTALRPPVEVDGGHDYVTEIHPQAEAFIRTLADRLHRGAAFFIDYGFPEHEYYHPQRSMGTVMCHRGHLMDGDALSGVGGKDITAHVNFTGIALAGQEAGLQVLGYTGQGRFLLNCGLLEGLDNVPLTERTMVQRLVAEHEMGELFKVIAFGAGLPADWTPLGFSAGDRSHTL